MRPALTALAALAVLSSSSLVLAADPVAPPTTADLDPLPPAGIKDGLVYLREQNDVFRLYPHALLDLDAHAFFGSGVDSLTAQQAGVDLQTRFFLRHARLDLAGEIIQRVFFDAGAELVSNPATDGASAHGLDTKVVMSDAWAKLDAGRGLNFTLGVFQAPFSLENRTAASQLAMMERNIASRGFITPNGKVLGASMGGANQHDVVRWDVGAFGADTTNTVDYETHFDAIGRVTFRPFANSNGSAARDFQFGASARAGTRHPRDVTGDAPAITTGQGFAMWSPTRLDAAGHVVHVIPSSLQWAAGGEVRWPFCGFELKGEAYWVSRNTRESLDGQQASITERLGQMSGVGWYAELDWWMLQSFGLVAPVPPPTPTPHADHLELARTTFAPARRGLEFSVLAAGINATYDGASRGGPVDPSVGSTTIAVYQIGGAVNYWHSSHLRFSINANAYLAPGSGTSDNAAIVPGNLGTPAHDPDEHKVVEVGARTSVMF